jgi:hypothetical protein
MNDTDIAEKEPAKSLAGFRNSAASVFQLTL